MRAEQSAVSRTADRPSLHLGFVPFDLILDRLRGMFVGVDRMAMRKLGMVAGGFEFVVDKVLCSRTMMGSRKFKMLGGEFVVIFNFFHGWLLDVG